MIRSISIGRKIRTVTGARKSLANEAETEAERGEEGTSGVNGTQTNEAMKSLGGVSGTEATAVKWSGAKTNGQETSIVVTDQTDKSEVAHVTAIELATALTDASGHQRPTDQTGRPTTAGRVPATTMQTRPRQIW